MNFTEEELAAMASQTPNWIKKLSFEIIHPSIPEPLRSRLEEYWQKRIEMIYNSRVK